MARSTYLFDHILGSKSKVAALRVLYNSGVGLSGSAVAKQSDMALLGIQNALSDLEHLGLIIVERGPVEYRYKLNFSHYLVENGILKLYESESEIINSIVAQIRSLLKGKVVSAGLFGSFVRGEATPKSDVDLLVITSTIKDREIVNNVLSDNISTFISRYGLSLQPVIYERRRFTTNTKGMTELLDSAEKDWVHIVGENIHQFRQSIVSNK